MQSQGIHLLRHAVYRTAQQGGQFVLLGSGHADGDFRGMAGGDFRESRDVRLMITYSDRLAHLLYAAADIILVPSLFEPCGAFCLLISHLNVCRKRVWGTSTGVDVQERVFCMCQGFHMSACLCSCRLIFWPVLHSLPLRSLYASSTRIPARCSRQTELKIFC